MDVLFFLKERTAFIRRFYDTACGPFNEIVRKIETEESPFEPPYGEDADPSFELEWNEARTSIEAVGHSCLAMLAASLQLYFKTWERELGLVWDDDKEKKRVFRHGYVQGYKRAFGQVLKIDWKQCPADFDILEQIVLARNDGEHSSDFSMFLGARHSKQTQEKFKNIIFQSEMDRKMFSDPDMAHSSFLDPRIHISRDALFAAIEQVEMLAGWLEEKMFAAKYPSARRNSGQMEESDGSR